MPERRLSAVVLAAGEGTRMRSERPKPLHLLCGRPMILHVLDAMAEVDVRRVVVVVGHRAEWVTKTLVQHAPPAMEIEFVEQLTRTGTGDALAVGLTGLPDDDDDETEDVVVLPGDTPLLRPQTLAALVRAHRAEDAGATLLTAVVENPLGYGRVVHGKDGDVTRVVEEADATEDEKLIDEVNTSIYCFRRSILAPTLRRLSPANAQGEYYLTDAVGVLSSAGYSVRSLVLPDSMEAAGVNDRAQLAVAEAELRDRINERWMRRGVTMWDPERTYVDAEVHLEADVSLLPGVILRGNCVVGAGAEIGPNSVLTDTTVGDGAVVAASVCTLAAIGAGRTDRSLQRARARRRGRAGHRVGTAFGGAGAPGLNGAGPQRPGGFGARTGRTTRRRAPVRRTSVIDVELIPRRRLEMFSGRAHPALARDIATHLGVELGEANLREFANGEIYCKYDISIRGCDVFIVQTHATPGERLADGAPHHDRRCEARVGQAHHRRLPLLRLLAPGPQVDGPRADHGQARRRHALGGGCRPGDQRRPALGADPGLLRHALRPPGGGAGPRGVHARELRRQRRRRGARRRAGEGGGALQPASRLRPGPDPQDAAAGHLQRGQGAPRGR